MYSMLLKKLHAAGLSGSRIASSESGTLRGRTSARGAGARLKRVISCVDHLFVRARRAWTVRHVLMPCDLAKSSSTHCRLTSAPPSTRREEPVTEDIAKASQIFVCVRPPFPTIKNDGLTVSC